MPDLKKQQKEKKNTQPTLVIERLIDKNYEPDACDVVAVDLTTDEELPEAKGGIA